PETRNPEPETRNTKPDTRNPKHELRTPKPETTNQAGVKPSTPAGAQITRILPPGRGGFSQPSLDKIDFRVGCVMLGNVGAGVREAHGPDAERHGEPPIRCQRPEPVCQPSLNRMSRVSSQPG
ncbi:hypothetical protein T484DRAFT_1626974, partial [Baffinella frigidus]